MGPFIVLAGLIVLITCCVVLTSNEATKKAIRAEAAVADYLERIRPLTATVIKRDENGVAKKALYQTRSGRWLTAKVVYECPGIFVSLKRTKNGPRFHRDLFDRNVTT